MFCYLICPGPPTCFYGSHRKTAAAIGGSVGGVTLIAAVVLTVLYNRRRISGQSQPEIEPDPALAAGVFQPSSPWSPDLPHTKIDANRQLMSEPLVQRALPTSVNTLPVLTARAAPFENPTTPETSVPSALPEALHPPRSSTANVQLTDEEVDFIRDLRSADVPATDIARIIQRMKTEPEAAVGEGSSSGVLSSVVLDPSPPGYDFKDA